MEPHNSSLEGPISLFKFGLDTLKKHWKILVPLLIISYVTNFVSQLLVYSGNGLLALLGILVSTAGSIIGIAGFLGAIDAMHHISTDSSSLITFKGQIRKGFTFFWSLVLLAIIAGFVNLGSFALLFIPGIAVAVYTAFYYFTLVVDGKKGFSALTESFAIVRGRWWKVFGRFLFLVLVAFVVSFVVATILGIFGGESLSSSGDMASYGEGLSFGALVVTAITNILIGAVIGPFALGYAYRLYSNLKSTRTDGDTKTFKGWLVAFLCVGIVAMVVGIVLLLTIGLSFFKSVIDDPALQAQIQSELQNSDLNAQERQALEDAFDQFRNIQSQ